MKTHIIRTTEDLEKLRVSFYDPAESAKAEAKLLKPVFAAWGKRLMPHQRGEDISARLERDYVNVARFTGSFIASDQLIVTSREFAKYCASLERIKPANDIYISSEKPLNGPYGHLFDITHQINQAYHSFGFWRLSLENDYTQTHSFIGIHAQFLMEDIYPEEMQQLMNAFGRAFFYTNHDPLHHLTTLGLNDNINGMNNLDHQGLFRQLPEESNAIQRRSFEIYKLLDHVHYEQWANVSYRLTFLEMMKDENFVEQIQSDIRDYFDVWTQYTIGWVK